MRDGCERRIEEGAARDAGFSDDADVVGHAETVLLDDADDPECGIVALGFSFLPCLLRISGATSRIRRRAACRNSRTFSAVLSRA